MASITLKNIPESLYEKIKEAAQLHRRSLNSEILYCVERTLLTYDTDVEEHLRIARQLRVKTAHHSISEEQLNAAKQQGRP